ncbi:hypothetical protein [Motilimonas eburnea]|uniref:hypothetical protein n=1 Tax=Motilimonas eburnea TaxID=1737488 RepID=UPI001E6266FE|nr:hypothetical protein [Motilimonas eburnea]MCE2571230.1 hypothetical protein [Motilimonas eburnea]
MRRFIPCLVVLLERPRLGQCRLGLTAELGAKRAMQLSQLFIECALEDAKVWPGKVVLAVPEQDLNWAEFLADTHQQKQPWQVVGYQGHGISHHLVELDNQLRQQGLQQFIYIAADSPVLSGDHYRKAILLLQNYPVIAAHERTPANGFTLLGNTQPWPDLSPIEWHAPGGVEQLQFACLQHGLAMTDLVAGYRVIDLNGLTRLQHDLGADSRPARKRLLQAMQPLSIGLGA